jgi:hypothetical protein
LLTTTLTAVYAIGMHGCCYGCLCFEIIEIEDCWALAAFLEKAIRRPMKHLLSNRSCWASDGSAPLEEVQAVYGSGDNSLTLMTDGRVMIWGNRGRSDLGQGSAQTPFYQPLPVAFLK